MFGLSTLQGMLVGMALALIIGFGAGWNTKGAFDDSAQLKKVAATERVSGRLNDKAAALTEKAAEQKDHTQIVYKTVTKEIIKYVPATPAIPLTPPISDIVAGENSPPLAVDGKSCGAVGEAQHDWRNTNLSVAAVRVLNSGRADTEPEPASASESQTPTAIGLRELSTGDAEVVRLYKELAAEHNALVDYVDELLIELKKLRKK